MSLTPVSLDSFKCRKTLTVGSRTYEYFSLPDAEKNGLDADYPDRTRKPVDAPFPPYADGFSQEQHTFGPWKPIEAARKAGAP